MDKKEAKRIALRIVQGAIWREFMNPSSLTTDEVSNEDYPKVEAELSDIIGEIAKKQSDIIGEIAKKQIAAGEKTEIEA